jgi:hypothetical protein
MTTRTQLKFSELELVEIEAALRLLVNRCEEDEHHFFCLPNMKEAEQNARDRRKFAKNLADKINDTL